MQMGIRRFVKHHPGTLIANCVWEPIPFCVERPQDHVVWPNGNSRARSVVWCRGGVLICSTQHVYETWRGVCGHRVAGISIPDPLETHGVGAHWNVSNSVLVPREGCPVVCSLT
jgi:hypothetical protein